MTMMVASFSVWRPCLGPTGDVILAGTSFFVGVIRVMIG